MSKNSKGPFFLIFAFSLRGEVKLTITTISHLTYSAKLPLLLLLPLLLFSCKKYEEGDNFTIHSKKGRLENRWKIQEQLVNGSPATFGNFIRYYEFFKNGKYEFEYDNNGSTVVTGSWDFYDHKKSIIIHTPAWYYRQYIFTETYDTLRIKKLEKDELWMEESFSGITVETRYVPY